LSGLAGTGVQKIMGNGLYIKKDGSLCEIETDGKRLLLQPVKRMVLAKMGDGLHMKKQEKCATAVDFC